jgi:F-type H+-transporting ATPase subunit b
MTSEMHLAGGGQNIFILPNGTFFVEVIIFLVVIWLMSKFVMPPINRALKKRSDMVEQTAEDNRKAAEYLEAAEAKYNEALAEARSESSRIREEARDEGRRQLEQMRQRAQAEADEIRQRGLDQLNADRDAVVQELRAELDDYSVRIASRIVGTEIGRNGGPR